MTGVLSYLDPATNEAVVVTPSNPLPVTGGGGGGLSQVEGNVASGAADSGNPVKIGGRYNATRPVLTNGQRCDMQMDNRGNIAVNILARDGTDAAAVTNGTADGVSTVYGALVTAPYNRVYNGTTWDRQRGSAGEGTITKPYAFGAATFRGVITAGPGNNTIEFGVPTTRLMITSLTISQDSAATNNTISIRDGTTTRLFEVVVPAGAGIWTFYFPVPLRGSVNTVMNLNLSNTGPVTASIQGYRVLE